MAEWGSDGREEGVMGRVGIRRGGGRFDGRGRESWNQEGRGEV